MNAHQTTRGPMNRRRSPRNAIFLPADTILRSDTDVLRLQSVIRDISVRGALIALARGEEIHLRPDRLPSSLELGFRLPRLGESVRTACTPARFITDKDGISLVGVEFRHATPDDLSRLKLYLASLETQAGPKPAGNAPKALVVDDDEIYRLIVRGFLEGLGFAVDEAHDGRQGIEQFKRRPADLVVVDILMPEKDGLETIRELKALNYAPDIVAISGGLRGIYNPLKAARAMGASRTLKKPFDRDMLLAVLLSLPRRARQLAETDLWPVDEAVR
jgi:CheY-like chemotaxis protein